MPQDPFTPSGIPTYLDVAANMLNLLRIEQAERQQRKAEMYRSWVKYMVHKKKAPALGRPQMSRMTAALKLRTIREQHVHAAKSYNDRLMLSKSIEEKRLATNRELEYNRLLGASQFGRITPFAIGRLNDLKTVLNKR